MYKLFTFCLFGNIFVKIGQMGQMLEKIGFDTSSYWTLPQSQPRDPFQRL